MLDFPKKKMEDRDFLERVWGAVFNVGVAKCCYAELDGFETNLVGKVSKEVRCVLADREVGVMVKASNNVWNQL